MSKTIYHFGVSGGKDSTALLLWACYESGIPLDQIRVTFCNTGNEHDWTWRFLAMLHWLIHPIEVIQGALLFYDLAIKKRRFPSPKVRFCTQELKMKPTRDWIEARWAEGYEVILHSGVRAAESAERAKLSAEEWDPYYACTVRRPLLGYTIDQIWEMHEKYGVPRNPLYDIPGVQRVGCWPCMMLRKAEMGVLARVWPERVDFLAQKELSFPDGKQHSFFARDKVPLCQRTGHFTNQTGKTFLVATAHDVARWSRTVRGGKQYALGTIEEDAFQKEDDKTISCPSAIGQCE